MTTTTTTTTAAVCEVCTDPAEQYAAEDSREKYGQTMCEKCFHETEWQRLCDRCGTDEHTALRKQPYNPMTGSAYFECTNCNDTWH